MKNKIIKYISVMLILFTCFFYCIGQNAIKADSGWDSSYDPGGSGGGWNSNGEWNSGGSGGSGFFDELIRNNEWFQSGLTDDKGIILFTIFIVIVIFAIIYNKKNDKKKSTKILPKKYDSVSEEEIKKIIPDFNKQRFLNDAYQKYIDIQKAYSNFDSDTLKKLLSEELYQKYNPKLKAIKSKKEKNILSDFVLDNIDISSVKLKDDIITLTCILRVNFFDYTIDKNEKIIEGSNTKKVDAIYELTFTSTINQKEAKNCPNCGASVKIKTASYCENCGSKLIKNSYNWLLDKKEELLKQFK